MVLVWNSSSENIWVYRRVPLNVFEDTGLAFLLPDLDLKAETVKGVTLRRLAGTGAVPSGTLWAKHMGWGTENHQKHHCYTANVSFSFRAHLPNKHQYTKTGMCTKGDQDPVWYKVELDNMSTLNQYHDTRIDIIQDFVHYNIVMWHKCSLFLIVKAEL